MRQITAIFLGFLILIGSLIPQTDFEELSKLPDLINHYQEHHAKDDSLSFVSFLQEHYASKHRNEEDHSKLPLQKHCSCVFLAVIQPLGTVFGELEPASISYNEITQNPVLGFWNGSDYRLNLLKPPKV